MNRCEARDCQVKKSLWEPGGKFGSFIRLSRQIYVSVCMRDSMEEFFRSLALRIDFYMRTARLRDIFAQHLRVMGASYDPGALWSMP